MKAEVYKKLQCVRAVLYNTELCSWQKSGEFCNGLDSYDDGFYKNLTQFKCNISPTVPRRYFIIFIYITANNNHYSISIYSQLLL